MALLIFLLLMLAVGLMLVVNNILNDTANHLVVIQEGDDWVMYKDGIEVDRIKYYKA